MDTDIRITDPEAYLRSLSLLIKPAGPDCNLRCEYCFYLPKHAIYPGGGHRLSREVMHRLIGEYMEIAGDNPSFGWQGGEPTLLGVDFFRSVVAVQLQKARPGQSIANGLQTNGMLINDEWARFFRRYNFLIGVSLDGPKHIHDHYRRTPTGDSTWDRVMRSTDILYRNGAEFNVLCMVTAYSGDKAGEIYDFYMQHNLRYLQFIPCIERDPETGDLSPYNCTPRQFGEFLCTIFDRWQAESAPRTYVRMMDDLLMVYLGHECPSCDMRRTCADYLLIEHNGDVYPCDFFVEPEYRLGNVMEAPLREIALSEKFMQFRFSKTPAGSSCEFCPWFGQCHGGCQRHRLTGLGAINGPSYFCESYRMLFEHSDARLKEMARELAEEGPEVVGPNPRF